MHVLVVLQVPEGFASGHPVIVHCGPAASASPPDASPWLGFPSEALPASFVLPSAAPSPPLLPLPPSEPGPPFAEPAPHADKKAKVRTGPIRIPGALRTRHANGQSRNLQENTDE
jgi:hypothetical protein